MFLYNLKGGSGDKLKAKTSDIYYSKSHIQYYNFYQQYEDHFATARASEPNQILFVDFFLGDQINFRWQ